MKHSCTTLIEKSEKMRLLRRCIDQRKWDYNIKTDFKETGCECLNWISQVQYDPKSESE